MGNLGFSGQKVVEVMDYGIWARHLTFPSLRGKAEVISRDELSYIERINNIGLGTIFNVCDEP